MLLNLGGGASLIKPVKLYRNIQLNFSGSNTDGSFTMAVSNPLLSPLEKTQIAANLGLFWGDFLFYIENGILCVPVRIASMRRF